MQVNYLFFFDCSLIKVLLRINRKLWSGKSRSKRKENASSWPSYSCQCTHCANNILKIAVRADETAYLTKCLVSGTMQVIDKLYTQMGKVFHLTGELNLLLFCFGLSRHYSCKHLTLPAGPVSLNHGTVREWKIRLNLKEEASHPSLFPSTEAVHIIYIWCRSTLLSLCTRISPDLTVRRFSWAPNKRKVRLSQVL